MAWLESHLLTSITFFPLAWAAVGLLIPVSTDGGKAFLRNWTLLGSLLTFGLSVLLYQSFSAKGAEFQFTEMAEWIPGLGISYNLGVDGISLWLILLTTFLTPVVVLASYSSIEHRTREYYFLLLALETGMLGAFVALDIFLFYVFWEVMLLPMYLLVGIWGGKDRIYAAMKFFIYTMVGSLLMLVAIFYLAQQHHLQFGTYSTALLDLYKVKIAAGGLMSPQCLLFLAFSLAFAIKVPLFPLHTWLPDAHVQAPTAGSVILAGVLLKMGGYGWFHPLCVSALSASSRVFSISIHDPGLDRDRLRRMGGDGPARHQETGRVLFSEPYGLRHSRALLPKRDRRDRRRLSNAESWNLNGRTVPSCRHDL
jgi:NADH-quinone oxidoreductase subunit M